MAFIGKMELSDAKQTSKMTKEIMLDCWARRNTASFRKLICTKNGEMST